MTMLRWICGHKLKNRVRSNIIQEKVGAFHLEEKIRESKLRWFKHVCRRLIDALVRACKMI